MVSAIIVAAGSSSRMNGIDKQLARIGNIPVFVLSALKFERSAKVGEIIIAAPAERVSEYEKLAREFGVSKLSAVTAGGSSRMLSVKNALTAVSGNADFVAIHDGARPLIETSEIDRVIADAEQYGAAIAAAPAVDTMKLAKDGFVESTPPRGQLFSAQTPQVFKKDVYLNCLEKLGASADDLTDDSGAVALCGVRVKITEIKGVNFKITRPEDLALAKTLVESVSTR